MSGTSPSKRPWYADGIRFGCQKTGACCTNHGEYAYVYLTREDEQGLATELGQTVTAFRRRHTRVMDGHRVLKNDGDRCRFLSDGRCTVYAARPVQCQTWPFWRYLLDDEEAWRTEVAPFCAGVGCGRLYSREEIDAIAARHDDED